MSGVRRMAAVVTKSSSEKTPGNWWVIADKSRGMGVLADSYEPANYPIISFDETFLAVDKEGGSSWGLGIPKGLDDKLRGRQNELPKVNLVCLGALYSEESDKDQHGYFVQFEDENSQWSDDMDEYLQGFFTGSPMITVLAFAPGSSYYCKNDLGTELYCNLPKGLHDALKGRKSSLPEVQNVNLGPQGEWFVRFEDGSWSCSGMTDLCDETIDEIKGKGGKISEILFGQDDTWMIRYDENLKH